MASQRSTLTGEQRQEASLVSLNRLPQGTCGRVTQIDVAKADLQRLEVMGICPGRFIHIVKQGDPLIVRVLGTRIGLASMLATFVYVQPADPH